MTYDVSISDIHCYCIYLLIVRRVEGELEALGLADRRRDDLPLAPAEVGDLDGRGRGGCHLSKAGRYC